ncbi:hypothetical protein GCM10010166_54180 [Couchioplanes caeruleus subsp. azureus]|nr:hypothetical protein GCM10010166_54180 [Couchioplanes caeruleus subsp. azureus]
MNTGSTSKRCHCRDRGTGKPLGSTCPKLRRGNSWNPNHGQWQYQIELPRAANGRRRPLRRGGFDSPAEAGDVLRRITDVTGLLTMFMTSRGGGRGKRKKIKEGTRRSYQGHIDNHLIPHLGTVRADRLTAGLIEGMFDKIEERNDRLDLYRASPDPKKQREVKGLRTGGIATQHRILATLRAAYNWAMRRGIVTVNPAKLVEIAPEKAPKKAPDARRAPATGAPRSVTTWDSSWSPARYTTGLPITRGGTEPRRTG